MPDVVERLERHAAGQRTVADDREDRLVAAARVACERDAERDRERVGRMTGVEGVVTAISLRLGKPHTPPYWRSVEKRSRRPVMQLVDVGLVPDVEDDAVVRAVESAMDAQRELDDPEVRGEVTAGLRDGRDELLADLVGQLRRAARRRAP